MIPQQHKGLQWVSCARKVCSTGTALLSVLWIQSSEFSGSRDGRNYCVIWLLDASITRPCQLSCGNEVLKNLSLKWFQIHMGTTICMNKFEGAEQFVKLLSLLAWNTLILCTHQIKAASEIFVIRKTFKILLTWYLMDGKRSFLSPAGGTKHTVSKSIRSRRILYYCSQTGVKIASQMLYLCLAACRFTQQEGNFAS